MCKYFPHRKPVPSRILPSMLTLIDGYNLMHARGLMPCKSSPEAFHKARKRFLGDLSAAMGPEEARKTTVVFDASNPPPDRSSRHVYKGIEVVFAVGDENADARIEAMIAAHSSPKALTVVSSDLRVRKAASRRRAKVVLSDDFLVRLAKPKKSPGPIRASLSAEEQGRNRPPNATESAFWLEEFSEVADDPESIRGLRSADFVPSDEEIERIAREVEREG